MKAITIFLLIFFLTFITPLLHAQSNRRPASAVTLQDIYNRIDGVEQRFGQKFEAMDKKLIEIEKTLAGMTNGFKP